MHETVCELLCEQLVEQLDEQLDPPEAAFALDSKICS